MKKSFFIALLLLPFIVGAQSLKLKKAENHFTKLNYFLAKPLYQELHKKNPKDFSIVYPLASCYYFNNEMEKAYKLIKEYPQNEFKTAESYYLFSQICFATNRITEGENALQTMTYQFPAHSNSIQWKSETSRMEERLKWKSNFQINLAKFNSFTSDFGGYPTLNGNTIILSSRGMNPIGRKWSGSGENFLDYFQLKSEYTIKRLSRSFNSKYHEGPLAYHPNGKWVYFTSNNQAFGKKKKDGKQIQNLKLYKAEVKKNGSWTHITELKVNSKEFSLGHPTISKDGKQMIFVSDMNGGFGGTDLYSASIDESGELQNIKNLGMKLNTIGDEMFPWISPKSQLFFSSNTLPGYGGMDIFVTEFNTNSKPISPKNLGLPMNSNRDDFAMIFSDSKKGYFSSNREGLGGDDVYTFEQMEEIMFKVTVKGTLKNKNTQNTISDNLVVLLDSIGNIVDSIQTDEYGNFNFELDPAQKYSIKSSKTGFESDSLQFFASTSNPNHIDLNLREEPKINILAIIKETKTGTPVQNVTLKITDKNSNKIIFEGSTDQLGTTSTVLNHLKYNQNLNLQFELSKPGYLSKKTQLNQIVTESKTIRVHELIDINLVKVEVGINLAELIDINPIYFDLGKFIIRKDAAIELDKIIAIMNEYPNMVIQLGSHTDCRGTKDANKKLSDNRAKASADYIRKSITNPTRISGVGFGESKLKVNCPCEGTVVSNCPEEEHAKNRRTEFIVKKVK